MALGFLKILKLTCLNLENGRKTVVKVKKVKTSIHIARFMHQAPLTRTSLKLGRQTAI